MCAGPLRATRSVAAGKKDCPWPLFAVTGSSTAGPDRGRRMHPALGPPETGRQRPSGGRRYAHKRTRNPGGRPHPGRPGAPHPVRVERTPAQTEALKARIRQLLREQDAVLAAHYYTDSDLQDLADETGGCVADSLGMARFGTEQRATTLVVAGVRFMGETSKILNNEKRVLMPDLNATCSLDENCPADLFGAFCDRHPDHTVVVYANTSAEVKARSHWVVTSGIALPIVRHLAERGERSVGGRTGTWAATCSS